jgi:hypothetical protein
VIPSCPWHLVFRQPSVAKIRVFSALFKLMLVRKIWKFSRKLQMKKEGGPVGEALDRVGPGSLLDSGRPDSRKGELVKPHPRP